VRDLASLTAADFDAAAGSVFELVGRESVLLELRLTEVVRLRERPGHRQPFSLLFRGPLSPVAEQDTHRLVHAELGELEIFLGPIAADADGVTYEAVFS
jgi:hypothetical protein